MNNNDLIRELVLIDIEKHLNGIDTRLLYFETCEFMLNNYLTDSRSIENIIAVIENLTIKISNQTKDTTLKEFDYDDRKIINEAIVEYYYT